MEKVNLKEKLARFTELWSPRAVGAVNDFHVKLVKLKGEFVWHSHDVEDELFLVLEGSPTIVVDGADHPLRVGSFARLDPELNRTVRNDGESLARVLIVSAPVTSGYEPLGWA